MPFPPFSFFGFNGHEAHQRREVFPRRLRAADCWALISPPCSSGGKHSVFLVVRATPGVCRVSFSDAFAACLLVFYDTY
jgi:hypothetical protein